MVDKNHLISNLIKEYPDLKEKLIKRNKVFSRLSNPVVFNTVGKFAKISDVAKASGENLDELLEFINANIK
ncbi:MAG: DUF1858 domain-containing protein [Bacteroidales bacterium]|nr:DUF1858 domain-containing protein [Bacteroidales bacterium]